VKNLNFYIEILMEYIKNNGLVIDKEVYLTIVIGQITIYAILMTFYQFIVSFQGGNKGSIQQYLGYNLIEYYIYNRLKIYKHVVSKKTFGFLFVLEIIYKPVVVIFGQLIPRNIIVVLNFWWYMFAVAFFVIFVLLFFQCTNCVLSIKAVIDKRYNGGLIRQINRKFIKKSFVERWKKKRIELLKGDMDYIGRTIKKDDEAEVNAEYVQLIIDVWDDYERSKEKEIGILRAKGYKTPNQVAWEYNMNSECWLLSNLLSEKYIQMSHMLERFLGGIFFRLFLLNMQRAQEDKCREIIFGCYYTKANAVDCKEWRTLLEEIFSKSCCDNKQRIIDDLYTGINSDNILYKLFCEKLLRQLISISIQEVYIDRMQQKDFVEIFDCIRYDEVLNEYLAQEMCEYMISYNKKTVLEIISLLSKENSTYIFTYLIIYYSIYKFRFKWEYINIPMLKELFKHGDRLEEQCQRIDSIISTSHISHRYNSEICTYLVKSIPQELTGRWLEEIYQQKYIDAFYITIIKLCVLGQEYNAYKDVRKTNAKILFVNELARHDEILTSKNVKEMILQFQFIDFCKLEKWSSSLDITLRTLLLLNMEIVEDQLNDEIRYFHYVSIGEYLLIKNAEKKKISSIKKKLIKKAYIASNMPVQEYVELMSRECAVCGTEIGYVKKEKMRNLLMKLI